MYTSIETWHNGKKWRLDYSGPREWAVTMRKDAKGPHPLIAGALLYSHRDGEKLDDSLIVGVWDGKGIAWRNRRTASSQAAWALLTEGVTRARVETHRMRHLVERALRLVSESEAKEQVYRVGGDIVVSLPKRLDALEIVLDRTSLALTKMGAEFLESRLPLSEKVMVDEAVASAFGKNRFRESVAGRVAARFIARSEARTEGR